MQLFNMVSCLSASLTVMMLLSMPYVESAHTRKRRGLYRDEVDPKDGGKVPESSYNRAEFNKIDAMGLSGPHAQAMTERLKNEVLLDVARPNPSGFPEGPSFGDSFHPDLYHPESYYSESYRPNSYDDRYAYHEPKPVGPVLLEKRPHEVTEIKAVPIPVHDTYTNFDCRSVPHPDRHYADTEANCQIYHFCHADGKQDTFHCPYGTMFNEYLGTCDHSGGVQCGSGGKSIFDHYNEQNKHHLGYPYNAQYEYSDPGFFSR